MVTSATHGRRRLSPEKRRTLILDHTAAIVTREGVAQLSVERIGKEAAISRSFVFAYFNNLTALLRELYQREMIAIPLCPCRGDRRGNILRRAGPFDHPCLPKLDARIWPFD
jgi:AcrR family transcriptional regulator